MSTVRNILADPWTTRAFLGLAGIGVGALAFSAVRTHRRVSGLERDLAEVKDEAQSLRRALKSNDARIVENQRDIDDIRYGIIPRVVEGTYKIEQLKEP